MLILASLGAFFGYINPKYETIKDLESQKASRDEALTKSRQLQALRDDLLKRLNTFPTNDLARLEKMLPDNIDNVRLIIDISALAAQRGVVVKNVKNISAASIAADAKNDTTLDKNNKYGSVVLDMTVSATYDNFIAFLKDLEKSLRLVDVVSLGFSASDSGNMYDFNIGIKTYWLK
ncbi:MAG: hypothetical protein RLZZ347_344 [Candidatus Parcubacteria bacterium]